ncbi:uncharacterized protein KQ657_000861 [Scheffersomyces spartinae]|uniref:Uncharacterized protein n=1 Tax=Scheffersomyces spartinae TaxID=45513 RepID=A0A9P7V8V7_9ASCO|nr:uncharacterized protein KQ657_000861 [Scheffersomyces spartinae]KAG7193443.1 hypothetical protein KQ657_000861 [Scheffersomyces spartinae]
MEYALVTGASLGIGYQLAITLNKRGYKVFGCAPESHLWEMKPLESEYGIVSFPCDITNVEDVKKAATFIGEQTGGRLDLLYNNAGIGLGGPCLEVEEKDVVKLFEVNVFGHMWMTKYMAEYVIAAKGIIVFTASVAARVPLSWLGPYCASKAAIDQYAKVLHAEMQSLGVRVYSVITGGVDTGIMDVAIQAAIQLKYYDVDGFYESLIAAARQARDKNIPPDAYAQQIVGDILNGGSRFNLYRGAHAFGLHFADRYLPFFLTKFFMAKYFKQDKVFSGVKNQYKLEERSKKTI